LIDGHVLAKTYNICENQRDQSINKKVFSGKYQLTILRITGKK